MKRHSFFAFAAAIAVLISHTSADAQRNRDWRPDNRQDWESLGTAQIGTRVERDVIDVGRKEGRFESIGFTVSGGDARIEELKIVYGNGQSEELKVREVFKSGTRSRVIDIAGRRGAVIRRIEIAYRAFGPVKIEFFGEKAGRGGGGASWVELGCHRVGFLESNDVIRVGKREGAFRALKLTVSDATLRLDRLRVVFGDRSTQSFDVRSAIPAGSETRSLDLDGRRRVIERIELEYKPTLRLKQGPRVCVFAQEGRGGGRPGPNR